MQLLRSLAFSCALASGSLAIYSAPEIIEIGPAQQALLPKGKEADGILGDFVLRNDRIVALVSGNSPARRANMAIYWNAPTPGCLYDLSLRDEANDQLTLFSPSGQQGPVSFVRIADETDENEAALETVVTAARNQGLYVRHVYRLRDGWQGLLVTTTFRNESPSKKTVDTSDRWATFTQTGAIRNIHWADAVDPAAKAGYAYAWMEFDGLTAPAAKLELGPGEEITVARGIAVGHSPGEAFGLLAARQGETGLLEGRVTDPSGGGLGSAAVNIKIDGATLSVYPDARGAFAVHLPPGSYATTVAEIGRASFEQRVDIQPNTTASLDARLNHASAVLFDIRDAEGRSIPCKAQFIGSRGTPTPNLGPANRAHGCKEQYFAETGQFRVQVPPGEYKIIVTHGIEFTHLRSQVQLAPGQTQTVSGTLRRVVDTRGWVSADFHNHSTPSGDNTCGTDDRIISLAVEQVEFAPTTEHNRLYDWRPHIEKLSLTNELNTVPGIELTGSGAHFNAFPYTPDPYAQDGGAPVWQKDPRLNAVVLRDFQGPMPERWVQINHPDMVENFIDRDADGHEDGGYWGLGQLIDGAETFGLGLLTGTPFQIRRDQKGQESLFYRREFIWLQLLNRGHRYTAVAVSDAHSVHGNGVGGWRMYVPSSTDLPPKIDWKEIVRNSKAGRVVLTTGPFLEVRTEDGSGPGDTVRAQSGVRLQVKVQCTDWLDINRVQVLVNGRPRPDLNFTRQSHPDSFSTNVVRFERTIPVKLSQDAHLIVVALGENLDLQTGYGTSGQASWNPCAYHNPIYADVDGHGFTANGDTLDWPLPTKALPVARAKELLDAHGHTHPHP